MHVVLSAYGSRGDVQPIAALGVALQARGHRVTLCAPENFSEWAMARGLPFVAVGGDMFRFFERTGLNVFRMTRALQAELTSHFDALTSAARGADLILGAGVPVAAPSVAEHLGIPYRFVAYCPLTLRSRFHAPPHFFPLRLPRAFNPTLWRITDWVFDLAGAGLINAFRRRCGLSPIRHTWEHVLGKRPVLAADAALAPLPADLVADVVQTGHWAWPQREATLPIDLEAFLVEGTPPLYVGFGSLPVPDPAGLINTVRALGCRAVVALHASNAHALNTERNVHVVSGEIAHDQLFPRCLAIVHHGGAGTTATAARCGVPQIVVPHMLDQHYWGHRVVQLGLGPAPIPSRVLSTRKLTSAVNAVTSGVHRKKASDFAKTLQGDGVESSVEMLVNFS